MGCWFGPSRPLTEHSGSWPRRELVRLSSYSPRNAVGLPTWKGNHTVGGQISNFFAGGCNTAYLPNELYRLFKVPGRRSESQQLWRRHSNDRRLDLAQPPVI